MTLVFAIAVGALALAPLIALAGRLRLAAGIAAGGSVLLVIVGVTAALGGGRPVLELGSWLGFGASALRVDGLAGIFLALTGLTGGAVALSCIELPAGRWLTVLGPALLFFVAVAIGAANGFLFLLAWEAITVCVYLIASAGRAPADILGGYLAGGLAKLGGGALLGAVALLYAHTHSFSLAAWSHADLSPAVRGIVFALFLAGFASKVGLLPLQGGLPAGYGSAPRLGAAWLSVALCAGFYGLWRFEFGVLGPLPVWCGDALLVIGALSALAGIVYALAQDDLKRFLGYSTVEHAGVAAVGFAVALLGHAAHMPVLAAAGLLAATLHVCAHGLAKTLALIGIDRVELASGAGTLDPLGGLARPLPLTAGLVGLASLTLAAIPPLGGFVSEWFTFEALLQSFRMPTLLSRLLCALAAAALALTAGLGLLAFAKYYGFIFLGRAREALGALREPNRRPLGALALASIVLFLGTAAPWEIHALGAGLAGLLGFDAASTTISHPLVLGPVFKSFSVLDPTWLSVVLPAYALIAVSVGLARIRRRAVRREPVWLTGAGVELSAAQYRPSAYSNPMRVILRGPLRYRPALVVAQEGRQRQARVLVAIDELLYEPATRTALALAGLVRSTQSGRLASYLLYMLAAVVIALCLVPILH
jgi:hydrogenase-4 component B